MEKVLLTPGEARLRVLRWLVERCEKIFSTCSMGESCSVYMYMHMHANLSDFFCINYYDHVPTGWFSSALPLSPLLPPLLPVPLASSPSPF